MLGERGTMDKVGYDLKDSKEVIGPLYPRLLDKQGREIDGFHREEADSEWPTTQLEHIDTDVKYWIARIAANTHRRGVKLGERKKEIVELAKALRDEEQNGIRNYSPSLVNTICELTTFSKQHVSNLLKDYPEFKKRPGAGGPSGVKLSLTSEQTFKQKPRKQTVDEEKLKILYDKVQKSVFTGQGSLAKYISDAKSLGFNVEGYEREAEGFKNCLQDSLGRRYEDVKDRLNNAYKRSTEIKKALSKQIKAEEERREKLKESLKGEATEASMKEAIGMAEKERIEKLLEEIPNEFKELKEWVREGFWSIEEVKTLINNSTTKERIKKVLEEANEKLKESVKTRKTSLIYAFNKVLRVEKHEDPPPLPEGVFDVIYADPPWEYYLPLRGAPDTHYRTMSLVDIMGLEVDGVPITEKFAENAILFLWATNPQLEGALEVVRSWGFEYKTNMVWVKNKIGTGYYFRAKHELLLLATRGDIPPPVEANRPPSVLFSPREEHSKKPDEVYDYIEVMYPNRRYLELFARNHREKWISWGLEI